ncbi:XRE family transcriptional regulator [Lacibacter luteus]|uniref:XRE family transcriptional regulator n=1 Tax=Lacibacter luteus TaxID=2508719 RepID=A0A4Q1CIW4_9BACT|nr:helix-turn-helix transcriptional regulator [Lacibacter luteus]RXK60044.1 XRE family transcriptional regulator [Lacibacter luteus]
MENSRYPNKLKLFRTCFGYSQKKVVTMLGLTDTSILSRWEHGLTTPRLDHVFLLARMYHSTPHELFDCLWEAAGNEHSLSGQFDHSNSQQSFSP